MSAGPDSSSRRELEQVRALLRQARADRDRLQERVLTLEHQVGWALRVPGSGRIAGAGRRLRNRRNRRNRRNGRDAEPVRATGTAPVRPGRYLNVANLRDPARSGIARVTVRLGRELGYDLVSQRGGRLVHDATFVAEVAGRPPTPAELARDATALVPGPGVTLLDPAIQLDEGFDRWTAEVRSLRDAGGCYVQVVHDLLPITLPDFFDYGMRRRFPVWLAFVTDNADLILADSQTTAATLRDWRASQTPHAAQAGPPIQVWPLGNDPLPAVPLAEVPAPQPSTGPTVLVVGTIEPRKAVDVVVDAVSAIRDRGIPASLTVIGRLGWADPALVARLADLAGGDWLTWRQNADDATLAAAYAAADVVVVASRGEGFGLPVVEAQARNRAVVARDLPEFRELVGDTGYLFATDDALADVIVAAWRGGPRPGHRDPVSWAAAAAAVDRSIDALDELMS